MTTLPEIGSNLTTTVTPLLDRIFSNTSLGHRLLERLTLVNLRHTLYLITPYETAVATLEEVPNYNVEVSAWWVTFVVLEFLILKISGHSDRFALNDSITSICAGMLSQCFKFGGRTVAIFLYVFLWNNFRLIELPWDSPWTWLLCLVFQDLMYYLGHRAVHEAGFFWGLHTIHHSSEYYNFSTALRQAAIQDAGLALYDVLQAFFIPPPIFLVHRYFSEILQFVMHTSLIGDLGPLGIIFNTPSHHRVHHGRNPYCIDKNYGGVFIIWDKMFGTFEAERKDDPPIYGLVHNENTFNQIYLQGHMLWDMLYFKGQMKDEKGQELFPGVLNKVTFIILVARTRLCNGIPFQIKAALYPPGWFPGVPVRPFFHWFSLVDTAYGVPEPEKPVVKYNPPLKCTIKLYILGHFILLLAVFLHFEYDRLRLDYADFTLKIAFFLVTMQTFSAFFDKLWYAPSMEISRCIGVVVFMGFTMLNKGVGPHRLFLVGIFGISALLWIGCCIKEKLMPANRVAEANNEKKVAISID
ncbi:fatty acid hydroxylase family protein [Oesophagostomum dentatum]|uniref:Fatty acid hydroxylase family protein n=1 Tax=Oesophagostomum dentatum TaxID=61180 RepID=A0A0B1T2M4_OESDE|nr:fatty acid hydroxylase family protein [Oesophagostomum dentatum]